MESQSKDGRVGEGERVQRTCSHVAREGGRRVSEVSAITGLHLLSIASQDS